jgi:hypothetical protein
MSTNEPYDTDCHLIKEIDDVDEMKELALKFKKEKNYDYMIIYYEMAIKKNDVEAMILLAKYYERRDPKKYENYMLLAIEEDENNVQAMNDIAYYYQKNDNYIEAKKYFLMAIEKEHTQSMWMLANLFQKEQDIESMKKYTQMAIDKGDVTAMYNFACYYQNKNDLPNAKKYFTMADTNGNKSAAGYLRIIEEYEKSLIPPPYSSKFNTEQLDNYLATSMIQMGNISVQLPTKNQIKTKQDLERIINNVNTEIGNTNQYRNTVRNIQKLLMFLSALSNKLGLQVQTHNFPRYGVN